jgi:hypothetical protein
MVKFRFFLLSFLFVIFGAGLKAQEFAGAVDNYSGSSSMWLNPSNISSSFVYADFGLATVDLSLGNNFLYLPSFGVPQYLFGGDLKAWPTYEGKQQKKEYYYLYYSNDKDKRVSQSLNITSPSFMTVLKNRHAIGFSIKQRVYTSARDVPWEIPVIITESIEYPDHQNIVYSSSGLNLSTLEWTEPAFAYSVTAYEKLGYKVDLGLSAKLLLGYSGVSAEFDSLRYEIKNDSTMYAYTIDGNIDISVPLDYDAEFDGLQGMWNMNPFYKGAGLGFDFGVTITRKKESNFSYQFSSPCDAFPVEYARKLGFSLLDVGAIRFKKNVLKTQIMGLHDMLISVPEIEEIQTINDMLSYFDSLSGDSFQTSQEQFTIGLPTAFSAQYDISLRPNFYVNAVWIQSIKLFTNSVQRASQLSITPRYETRNLGLALAFSLSDYRQFDVGFSGRFGPLTLGTTNLISFVGLGKTKGVCLYLSIRFKLERGNCFFTPLRDACGDRYRVRRR